MILFRPVGLEELHLIIGSGFRAFPPRRPEQPFFYPVFERSYAQKIARDWNTKDEEAGFAGFVTMFEVPDERFSRYPMQTVGAREHRELWVPAAELLDFNLACPTTSSQSPAVGTFAYMPPEQRLAARARRLGKNAGLIAPDRRGDVYSFGLVLFELLTLKNPLLQYKVHTSSERQPALFAPPFGPPSMCDSLREVAPEAIVRVARRCLTPDPSERYPSAVQLAADLHRCVGLQEHNSTEILENTSALTA